MTVKKPRNFKICCNSECRNEMNYILFLQVPDYYDIIAEPMDFLTIKNKINRFSYDDVASLLCDVRLVFSNCMSYNRKSTPEYKAGQLLSKMFEKRLKDCNIDEESSPPTKKNRRTL